MRGELTREKRLEISVTRLKNNNTALRSLITTLKKHIKAQDKEIAGLKEKLQDKESQRKQLLSYLYKENTPPSEAKKLGKKNGARGYHRPKPKEEEVTEEKTFSVKQCPHCRNPVDGIDKNIAQKLTNALRARHISLRLVQSRRDESEPLIRLADMWAGCIRGALMNGEESKQMFERAQKGGYLKEITT